MNTPKRTPQYDLVLYHFPCIDGFTAAWVAHHALPNAELVPINNGECPPDVTGRHVLVVDIAFERGRMEIMNEQAASLQVLDHHDTNEKALKDLPYAEFDMERSGAGMAWDHLHPNEPIRPAIVSHVEDRDLWRFALAHTRTYHAALTMQPFTFAAWDAIHHTDIDDIVADGRAVAKQIENLANKWGDRAVAYTLTTGQIAMVANVPIEFVSETGAVVTAAHPDRVFVGWSWNPTTNNYTCSLRSGPDGPDVGKIASDVGGGGHKHSAGFQVALPPPLMLKRLVEPEGDD